MSDRFVTIASYAWTPEAQLARNLLETEGIQAFLLGELTADALTGLAGEAHLQVREQDAARATSILAAVSAKVSLDENWEAQAERGLCPCAVCGIAMQRGESVCPACGEPNTRITTDRTGTWASRARQHDAEGVKKSAQEQANAPRSTLPEAVEDAEPMVPASRAGCAVLLFALLVLPLGLWCL
jgi:hypothetical protein